MINEKYYATKRKPRQFYDLLPMNATRPQKDYKRRSKVKLVLSFLN
jgi:hypothetical protein